MLPPVLHPMLAKAADGPFDSASHAFEVKWDGIRCIAMIESQRVRLQSRRLTAITSQFPELAVLARLPSGTALDGELVVMQDGKPSLHAVQRRAMVANRHQIENLARTIPVTFMVFDLPFLRGEPLLTVPFLERREQLTRLIDQFSPPGVIAADFVRQHGCALFAKVLQLGMEGIMAKSLDGPYLPGKRSGHWLKIKPKTAGRTSAGSAASQGRFGSVGTLACCSCFHCTPKLYPTAFKTGKERQRKEN